MLSKSEILALELELVVCYIHCVFVTAALFQPMRADFSRCFWAWPWCSLECCVALSDLLSATLSV